MISPALIFIATLSAQNTYPFPSSGSVGIGTASPHFPLEVVGGILGSRLIVGPYNALNDVSGVAGTLQFGNGNTAFITGSADSYLYKSQSTIGSLPVGTLISQIRSDITGGAFAFVGQSTPVPLMTILASGNVGIGTTDSHAPLEVAGRMIGSNLVVGSYANLNDVTGVSGTLQFGNGNSAFVTGSADAYIYKNQTSSGSFPFNTLGAMIFQLRSDVTGGAFVFAGQSTPTPLMTVLAGGNVGIGINTPSERLHINGNIRAVGNITCQKITVTQSGWPDYVFTPSFKLKPLSEVVQFIDQHKHLPGVPSAKEVEEKGIDVGAAEAILLKKIEELTLYIIAQDKRISQLESAETLKQKK